MGTGLDAGTLRSAMIGYLEALERHREELDSLNVFPVPDGDTGTNMLLTQRGVAEACGEADGASLGTLGETISRAALMAARGNSGVILSQILRGFCDRYCRDPDGEGDWSRSGRDLAQALSRAEEEARKAVGTPAEGTILSVLRDAARAAVRRGREADDQAAVAEAALEAARASLERTREQNPELRRAGVVDAGAKGLVLLLDALVATMEGVPPSVEVGPLGPVSRRAAAGEADGEGPRYGYEVMYLLEGDEASVGRLRKRLGELGDSVVVVGGGHLYQAHVHTPDAGPAVEAGIEEGLRPHDIRIRSLDEDVAGTCLVDQGRETRVGEESGPAAEAPSAEPLPGNQSIVAVAEGEGLERLFRSLGATVVRGGPGNNPAVRDLVEAIEAASGEVVHLLPNHRNVIPAAEAAARESDKPVDVVPTRSTPEGLAAALAFNPDLDWEDNAASMAGSAEEIETGAVARAEREADSPAGRVNPGDWLGIRGGEVRIRGSDPAAVAVDLVAEMRHDRHELLSLYLGADASDESGEGMVGALREALSGLEIEVHRGDQPRYPYLIGLE